MNIEGSGTYVLIIEPLLCFRQIFVNMENYSLLKYLLFTKKPISAAKYLEECFTKQINKYLDESW